MDFNARIGKKEGGWDEKEEREVRNSLDEIINKEEKVLKEG